MFAAWHAYADIPSREFAASKCGCEIAQARRRDDSQFARDAKVCDSAGIDEPRLPRDTAKYSQISIGNGRRAAIAARRAAAAGGELTDDAAEAMRQVLYGAAARAKFPTSRSSTSSTFSTRARATSCGNCRTRLITGFCNRRWRRCHAVVLKDRESAGDAACFQAGNPANLGDEVPRQFVASLPAPIGSHSPTAAADWSWRGRSSIRRIR